MKFTIVRVAQVLAAAASGQLNKESSVDTVIQRNAECHRDSAPGMKLNVSAAVADRVKQLSGSAIAEPVPSLPPIPEPGLPETDPSTAESKNVPSEPIVAVPETAEKPAADDAVDDTEA